MLRAAPSYPGFRCKLRAMRKFPLLACYFFSANQPIRTARLEGIVRLPSQPGMHGRSASGFNDQQTPAVEAQVQLCQIGANDGQQQDPRRTV